MTLAAMLGGSAVGPVPAVEVSGLQYDSRRIRSGDAFFAFPGENVDGHAFVPEALRKSAVAVVSERPAPAGLDAQWARVRHGRDSLARASLRFYSRPDRDLAVTAVTGTNGKTTTAHLIDSVLRADGRTTALVGTVEHRVGGRSAKAVNTTPESLDLVRLLAELRSIGGSHATMEASSHALALGRVRGIEFEVAVFTNLTPEHLDFHGDMESYAAAKLRLFEGAGARPPRCAVANADDPVGRRILGLGLSRSVGYGRSAGAAVRPRRVAAGERGLRIEVETASGPIRAETRLLGGFNVENVLAAAAALQCLGLSAEAIERGLRAAPQVPGRFESVDAGQPFQVIVDYAHTEDALRRLIAAGREMAGEGQPPGRVLTLFGCGGDRDPGKRAPMGRVAGRFSDFAVLTSDNPRSEDPAKILAEVQKGLEGCPARWASEPDRAAAIALALSEADRGDVVLIAGKGHETVQIAGDRAREFDDRQAAREALAALGYLR